MNLIEHLEYVIGLVERSASQSEIKGALVGMREEVSGYQNAATNQVALNQKHSEEVQKLKTEYANLEKQSRLWKSMAEGNRPRISGPPIPPIH
jgi:hypothetical protein